MSNMRKVFIVVAAPTILLGFVLVMMLSGCACACPPNCPPTQESETQVPTGDVPSWCQNVNTHFETEIVMSPTAPMTAYVRGQAIIVGDLNTIGKILDEILRSGKFENIVPLLTLQLEGTSDTINLVKIEPGEPGLELDFISDFNQAVVDGSLTETSDPIAEPNYVIRDPKDVTGLPIDSGVSGDPEGIFPLTISATPYDFFNQWAFSVGSGISLENVFDYNTLAYNREAWGAQPVRIVLFDSSPLETGFYKLSLDGTDDSFENASCPLCVSALISDISGSRLSGSRRVDSHGLFAAHLAHTVAPDSQIYLVQVLRYDTDTKALYGNLFTLLNAMHVFMGHDPSVPTVVNLSLGIDVDNINKEYSTNSNFREALDSISNVLEIRGDAILAGINPDLVADYVPVVSLQTLLSHYNDNESNIVFVAAAGNDGGTLPQTPGVYPWVIAVAASNVEGVKACFSNSGDVAAPGGDGDGGACTVDLIQCEGMTNCPYGVMSMVVTDDGTASYAYWAGTSFSTPLVSGMAALALADGESAGGVQDLFCADPNSPTPQSLCEKSVTLDDVFPNPSSPN
jgi:subtilisin family serine protease